MKINLDLNVNKIQYKAAGGRRWGGLGMLGENPDGIFEIILNKLRED